MSKLRILSIISVSAAVALTLFLLRHENSPSQSIRPPSLPRLASSTSADGTRNDANSDDPNPRLPTTTASPAPALSSRAATSQRGDTLVRAKWGSGPSELGRSQPTEANPEAVASFTRDSSGNIVVLDKVNGRLVRFAPDGKPLDTIPSPVASPQELLASPDGSLLVMDRLVDKSVAVLDKNGKVTGKLPIVGEGLDKGGSATGLFRDKDGVYVENEHSQVVRIGDASGKPDETRPTLDGRPTRDGLSLISAHLVDRATGRFFVRSVDRATGNLRYQRQLTLTVPLLSIVMLDSDPAGNIYAGVHVGQETSPGEMADEAVQVICLGPSADVLGVAVMAANTMPEESFRDLTVLDDGTILYLQRSESGVAITQHRCS